MLICSTFKLRIAAWNFSTKSGKWCNSRPSWRRTAAVLRSASTTRKTPKTTKGTSKTSATPSKNWISTSNSRCLKCFQNKRKEYLRKNYLNTKILCVNRASLKRLKILTTRRKVTMGMKKIKMISKSYIISVSIGNPQKAKTLKIKMTTVNSANKKDLKLLRKVCTHHRSET